MALQRSDRTFHAQGKNQGGEASGGADSTDTDARLRMAGLSLCGQQTIFRSMESSFFSGGTWRYW